MIHDVWMDEGGAMLRVNPALKVKRPQSHQKQQLVQDRPPITAKETSDVTRQTFKARAWIAELSSAVAAPASP